MPVIIRPASLDDLHAVTDIYNHYVLHTPISFDLKPFTLDQRRAWFAQFAPTGRYRLFVAEDDGVIVAYAGTTRYRERRAYDTTVEATVYCAPGHEGCGIGKRLYAALFHALEGEDVHRALAGITLPNPASVALHERFGFTLAGVLHEVGRKFGRYWDVALYEKFL